MSSWLSAILIFLAFRNLFQASIWIGDSFDQAQAFVQAMPEDPITTTLVAGSASLVVLISCQDREPPPRQLATMAIFSFGLCAIAVMMAAITGQFAYPISILNRNFGNSDMRSEGPLCWIDEIIWIVLALFCIVIAYLIKGKPMRLRVPPHVLKWAYSLGFAGMTGWLFFALKQSEIVMDASGPKRTFAMWPFVYLATYTSPTAVAILVGVVTWFVCKWGRLENLPRTFIAACIVLSLLICSVLFTTLLPFLASRIEAMANL